MSDNIPRFGANEFYLVETDALILREQLRSALSEILGRSVLDSDPHMVLASAFLPFLAQGQASADAAAKATLRAFAVGADLDRIADSTCVVGYMDRLPARGAVLAYWLRASVARTDGSAAEKIAVTWEAKRESGDVAFAGSGAFELNFAAGVTLREVYLPIYLRADKVGSEYNGLLPITNTVPPADDEFSASVDAIDSSGIACEVSDVVGYRCGSSYNGSDIEGDESFAARTAWQAKALRVPGSYEYFRLLLSPLYVLASYYVAPQVDDDGRIIMAWCDKCDIYARLSGVTLSDRGSGYGEFRDMVQASLLVEQRVMAYPAIPVVTGIHVSYFLPADTVDDSTARAAVERAWRLYVADHAWHTGAIISVSDISAVLVSAGASYVRVTSGGQVLTAHYVLDADQVLIDSNLTLTYSGHTRDYYPPSGTDGEEITP